MTSKISTSVEVDTELLELCTDLYNRFRETAFNQEDITHIALDVLHALTSEQKANSEFYTPSDSYFNRAPFRRSYTIPSFFVGRCRTLMGRYFERDVKEAEVIEKALISYHKSLKGRLKNGGTYRDEQDK